MPPEESAPARASLSCTDEASAENLRLASKEIREVCESRESAICTAEPLYQQLIDTSKLTRPRRQIFEELTCKGSLMSVCEEPGAYAEASRATDSARFFSLIRLGQAFTLFGAIGRRASEEFQEERFYDAAKCELGCASITYDQRAIAAFELALSLPESSAGTVSKIARITESLRKCVERTNEVCGCETSLPQVEWARAAGIGD
jgi:hypothetical protein